LFETFARLKALGHVEDEGDKMAAKKPILSTANPSYRRAITAPNPSKWQRMVETPVWNANSSYSLSTCQI
jgi:hypothetical protein